MSRVIPPINPMGRNVAIDANALDRVDPARAAAIDRLWELHQANEINLIVPKGVRAEFLHPRTPKNVKELGLQQIYTLQVELTADEIRQLREIELELQGNARPGKHAADAGHLFEAAKYCSYFITHDDRILDRAGKLRSILPPSLAIVSLLGFINIFDDYADGRRIATF